MAVVGSGAGGGTLAARLASQGLRVGLIEASLHKPSHFPVQDEQKLIIDQQVAPPPLVFNGSKIRPQTGSILGGSTSLYGGALLRPSTSDFTPDIFYQRHSQSKISRWPVEPDILAPYFTAAEDLYQVSGNHREPAPHLMVRPRSYQSQLGSLTPFNQDFVSNLVALGAKPFQMPLAMDLSQCLNCPSCPGYVCPTGARSSSYNRCILPESKNQQLTVIAGRSANKILVQGRKVSGLLLGKGLSSTLIRAQNYVLAAGTIGTPYLIQRSNLPDPYDLVGRNYMFHLGVICLSILKNQYPGAQSFHKQVALTDYYLGFKHFKHKLGLIQNIPITGPKTIQSKSPIRLPKFLANKIYHHTMATAMIIEDMPNPSNRVIATRQGIRILHRFHPYDLYRSSESGRYLKNLIQSCFPKAIHRIHSGALESSHLAHQVGTCPMGVHEKHSVVDPNCRYHHLDNLFLCDGSVLPSSLGVGPALTIIANALRVADYIGKECS